MAIQINKTQLEKQKMVIGEFVHFIYLQTDTFE